MQLSSFNVYVSGYPDSSSTLIYNSFSGGFVTVDAPTLAVLHKADSGVVLADNEQSLIDPAFFDDAVGVLVKSRDAEEQSYREWHEAQRAKSDELSAIVSTTFACNLDCTYCCQHDVLSGKTMTRAVAQATAAWLARRADEIGAKKIDVEPSRFAAGRPLAAAG